MESQSIEYKKTWRDEYLKWICAFANTEGGKLYIGIDDNGNVCGVDDPYKLSEDIPNKIRNTMGLICTVNLLNKGVTARCFASDKYLALMNEHQETENVPLNVPLTDRQKSIFEMIAKDKTLTAAIIADKLGKNEKTIKRDIDELKKQNLLKHSDSRNNGYWIILSGAEK